MNKAKLLVEPGCEAGSVWCGSCIHVTRRWTSTFWCSEFDTKLVDGEVDRLRCRACLDAERANVLQPTTPDAPSLDDRQCDILSVLYWHHNDSDNINDSPLTVNGLHIATRWPVSTVSGVLAELCKRKFVEGIDAYRITAAGIAAWEQET